MPLAIVTTAAMTMAARVAAAGLAKLPALLRGLMVKTPTGALGGSEAFVSIALLMGTLFDGGVPTGPFLHACGNSMHAVNLDRGPWTLLLLCGMHAASGSVSG
jgi:hypothetical protein